jgi:hypothetical protein
MKSRQLTIAFDTPEDIEHLAKLLRVAYKNKKVIVGHGSLVNGIPQNWILVTNE